jgi:hypothetical protein
MTFAEELKKWRGNMAQKNACDLFEVPLVTYKAWESGVREPKELAKKQIRFIMQSHTAGISVQILIQHYWRVIKQITAEIKSKNL